MFHRKTQNPDIQVDAKTICLYTLADIVQPPLLGVLLNNEHPHEQQDSSFNPPKLCSSNDQCCAVQLSVVLMSWHISVNLNLFLATSNSFPHTTQHSLKKTCTRTRTRTRTSTSTSHTVCLSVRLKRLASLPLSAERILVMKASHTVAFRS